MARRPLPPELTRYVERPDPTPAEAFENYLAEHAPRRERGRARTDPGAGPQSRWRFAVPATIVLMPIVWLVWRAIG